MGKEEKECGFSGSQAEKVFQVANVCSDQQTKEPGLGDDSQGKTVPSGLTVSVTLLSPSGGDSVHQGSLSFGQSMRPSHTHTLRHPRT
ncbi:hypothetical protein P4O66_021857 [Electrophorus voltai]|uniref:Uncharacterized protein n=1 Tax=Electrophorus voltai TaxID=2609070 RepID=A0AAD8ZQ39_9TELE|nr:hypothetical protein P4O66_021857 [Electrophorus voltai]